MRSLAFWNNLTNYGLQKRFKENILFFFLYEMYDFIYLQT